MDLGSKLIEVENKIYLYAVNELKANSISPSLGSVVMNDACKRITEDALFVTSSVNSNLEVELMNKMKEIESLKKDDDEEKKEG